MSLNPNALVSLETASRQTGLTPDELVARIESPAELEAIGLKLGDTHYLYRHCLAKIKSRHETDISTPVKED